MSARCLRRRSNKSHPTKATGTMITKTASGTFPDRRIVSVARKTAQAR